VSEGKEIMLAPLNDGMTREEWLEIGKVLAHLERTGAVQWRIGEWWVVGESRKWGTGAKLAEEFGLNYSTLKQYGSVVRAFPLCDRSHNLSFTHYLRVMSLPVGDRKAWLERAEKEQWAIRDFRLALARERLHGRHQALTYARSIDPEQRFPLVYADPPWKFETHSDLGKEMTSPDLHYETMTVDDICNLMIDGRHISEIAHDNCALFLWCTTSNFVSHALPVIEAWGCKYVTQAVWDKQKTSTGYVFLNQHEILIYAKRGDIPAPTFKRSSVFSYPRTKHSAKPPEVRQALEQMYAKFGKDERIELFARGEIPGWTVWGNEAVQDDTDPGPDGKEQLRLPGVVHGNVAPVAPKLEEAVKEVFLTDALKRHKRSA